MIVSPIRGGLELTLTVNVIKTKRKRCPRCGRIRVLFKLTAFGQGPVGDGPLLCASCGGLR